MNKAAGITVHYILIDDIYMAPHGQSSKFTVDIFISQINTYQNIILVVGGCNCSELKVTNLYGEIYFTMEWRTPVPLLTPNQGRIQKMLMHTVSS